MLISTFGVSLYFFAQGSRSRSAFAVVLMLLALGCATVIHLAESRVLLSKLMRMSEEGKFFLSLGGRDLIRQPLSPVSAMLELKRMKEEQWGLARGAGWFYDDLFLCVRDLGGKKIWSWNSRLRRHENMAEGISKARQSYCATIRPDVPLSVQLLPRHRRESLHWKLGPYEKGHYKFVIGDGVQVFEMPREGGFRTGPLQEIALQVKYESPDGWVTYSPTFVLNLSKDEKLSWSRTEQ